MDTIEVTERITHKKVFDQQSYIGDNIIIKREYSTVTPNGNSFAGRWVLRIDGELIDYDQYRDDVFERNGIKVIKSQDDLETARLNAEEDYLTTPISVLNYITKLEAELGKQKDD